MSNARNRVAVTGMSAVTALGHDVESTFRRLVVGERGFTEISEFDVSCAKIRVAAEIKNFRVSDIAPAGKAGLYSRADALALLAASQALTRANAGGCEFFLAVGGTSGGMRESEPLLMAGTAPESDAAVAQRLLSYPIYSSTRNIASVFPGVRYTSTYCSACSSSATALAHAASWVASGRCHCALAGGTDSLSLLTLTGFAALGAMSEEPCRPFDAARSGMSLGEGAAFLMLESEAHARARGAEILGWLDGWSLGAEAHHLTHPEPSGASSARLVLAALRHAGVPPEEVGYYNAHGTGTVPNDSMESNAVNVAFGEHGSNVRVSTVKGQIGHTLGAAGAVEAAVTLLALERRQLPPTGGLTNPADDTRLSHIMGSGVATDCRYAISGSFGFGGLGAVLAFARVDTENRLPEFDRPRLVVTGFAASPPVSDPIAALDPERSRRFDRVTALACVGAVQCNLNASHSGLVVSNACGNVERLRSYLKRLKSKGLKGIAPAEFPHLVPSAISGNTSIYANLKGPATNMADECLGFEKAIAFACDSIEQSLCESMVAGMAEAIDTGDALISNPFEVSGHERVGDDSVWLCIEDEGTSRRKGAQPLARLSSVHVGLGSWAEYFLTHEAPSRADRTRVYFDGVDGGLLDNIPGVGNWARAERMSAKPGFPAGRSDPPTIIMAIDAVARGVADQALVVSGQSGGFFVFRLEKP